jgi:hypothetical protein
MSQTSPGSPPNTLPVQPSPGRADRALDPVLTVIDEHLGDRLVYLEQLPRSHPPQEPTRSARTRRDGSSALGSPTGLAQPRPSSATTTPEQHYHAASPRRRQPQPEPAPVTGGQKERDADVREPILPPKAGDRPLRSAPPVKPSRVSKGGLETKLHASSPNKLFGF